MKTAVLTIVGCLLLTSIVQAEEVITDNLVSNPSFTNDTSNWTLSDTNNVKRDPNTYSGSASKSIRFRHTGSSITQDIDLSTVPEDHIVKSVNMQFQAIGCGNIGNEWCYGEADDTVVNTITLSDTNKVEYISNTTATPYEEGWSTYNFSQDVIGTFNTNDLDVSLNLQGNDTGDSSNWWGVIVDNISLTLTTELYIEPEPVIEIVPEPIVEIQPEPQNTIMSGIDLETSVLNDVILDIPDIPELPQINTIEVAVIEDIPVINDLPDIPGNIEVVEPVTTTIDELPVINDLEVVEEIAEINEIEVETVEQESAEEVVEEPTELVETTMEEDLAEAEKTEKKLEKTEKTTKEVKKEVVKSSQKPISAKKTISPSGSTPKNSTEIPVAYLQMIVEPITINQELVLTQVIFYEQDISDITGNYSVSSIRGSNPHSVNDMVGVKPKFRGLTEYRKE